MLLTQAPLWLPLGATCMSQVSQNFAVAKSAEPLELLLILELVCKFRKKKAIAMSTLIQAGFARREPC